jgi:hypothetical protein
MKTKLALIHSLILLLSILSFTAYCEDNKLLFNVKDFGAIGDGKNLDSKSIQETINQCSKSGGGTVIFPAGTYLSGSIEMFSNITLQLEAGSVIKGSPNLADYKNMGRTSEGRNRSLIYGIGVSNVAITGRGAVDGNDSLFMDWNKIHPDCCFDTAYTRQGNKYVNAFPDGPSEFKSSGRPGILITFIECHNILMRDVTIRNAPNWCVHLACCNLVDVRGVNFLNSLLVPNADAIDISNCKNVNISDCIMIAGDDGIAISPCADGFCKEETENINVSNCTITSRSSAIRIGWAEKSIRKCTFQNLIIYSNRGIGIFVKHDEVIEDLLFNNIVINTRLHTGFWGIGEPIHISEIPLGTWYGVPQNLAKFGVVRNVRFSNINIVSENCITLYAFHKNSIQNIDFTNIRHYFKNSPINDARGGNFELRPAFDNKYAVFKHDIPAFYAKNVKGLQISQYDLECDKDLPQYCTNAIFCEDFSDIKIDGFYGTKLNPGENHAVIHLENGEDATIINCKAKPGSNIFLEQKNLSKGGFFMNNDLREAKIPISGNSNIFKCLNNLNYN